MSTMNESTSDSDSISDNEPDRVTRLLMRYSKWKRERLLVESRLPMRLLILRSIFLTGCILLDGVFLPWIIIGSDGTTLGYMLFLFVFVVAVFLQAKFYFRWKATS
jgi:hypothetical protein